LTFKAKSALIPVNLDNWSLGSGKEKVVESSELVELVDRLAELSGVAALSPNTGTWTEDEEEEVVARFPEELRDRKWLPALSHVLWIVGGSVDSDDVYD
jgi:hypothetical protein